ncbi:HNH endonuclease, partial [Mycolicibacterium sp. BiH015]|nr:HNH endonuclease [Mycolicibacterium sp. BiH015]
HTYTTHPGSRLLFPMLCLPTATLWNGDPPQVPPKDIGDVKMPRRRRTRAHNRATYIAAQRLRNRTERLTRHALENGEVPPPDYNFTTDPRQYGNDPPPF